MRGVNSNIRIYMMNVCYVSVYSLYAAYTYKKAVNDIAKVFLCRTFLCVLLMYFFLLLGALHVPLLALS